jgi:hypothetical protein
MKKLRIYHKAVLVISWEFVEINKETFLLFYLPFLIQNKSKHRQG